MRPSRTRRQGAPRKLPQRVARPRAELDGPLAAVVLQATRIDPLRTTLTLSVRGGLTIPSAMRRALALDGGGTLIAELTPEGVLLRPAVTLPLDDCTTNAAHAAFARADPLPSYVRRRRRRAPR
jgi:hypothetical protein